MLFIQLLDVLMLIFSYFSFSTAYNMGTTVAVYPNGNETTSTLLDRTLLCRLLPGTYHFRLFFGVPDNESGQKSWWETTSSRNNKTNTVISAQSQTTADGGWYGPWNEGAQKVLWRAAGLDPAARHSISGRVFSTYQGYFQIAIYIISIYIFTMYN